MHIQEDARRVREALTLVKTTGWVETSMLQIMQQFCRLVESNFLPFGPVLGYILQTQSRVGKHVYQLDDGSVTEHVLPHCEEADKKLLEIVSVGLALFFAETRAAGVLLRLAWPRFDAVRAFLFDLPQLRRPVGPQERGQGSWS